MCSPSQKLRQSNLFVGRTYTRVNVRFGWFGYYLGGSYAQKEEKRHSTGVCVS